MSLGLEMILCVVPDAQVLLLSLLKKETESQIDEVVPRSHISKRTELGIESVSLCLEHVNLITLLHHFQMAFQLFDYVLDLSL